MWGVLGLGYAVVCVGLLVTIVASVFAGVIVAAFAAAFAGFAWATSGHRP